MSSTLGATVVAIRTLPSRPDWTIARPRRCADGGFLQPRRARYVERRRPERLLELHELDRDLDHEPVVPPEVELRDFHDPPQPLAERVRVDEEGLGARADVPAAVQKLLERSEE